MIVFLDFDGVLNHLDWMRGKGRPHPPFDPACVRRLAQICEQTGARIVVSSSWRAMGAAPPLERLAWLRGLLTGAGLGARGEVIGMTPDLSERPGGGVWRTVERHEEIRAWLAANEADAFVILDDDNDAAIEGHFVQTSFENGGLLDEHVGAAIKILRGEV